MTRDAVDLPDLDAPAGDLMFLLGVLFNQQIRAETAWQAPGRLAERLGGLDVGDLAATDPAALVEVMRRRPVVHPFANTMAAHVVGMCGQLVDDYDGHAANVWADQPPAVTLVSRLTAFPGIGPKKASVAVTLLAREYEVSINGAGPVEAEALLSCRRLSEVLTI